MGDETTKKRLPLRPHIFRVPDDPAQEPYLIGSRCRECGEHFFPVRRVCLACGTETLEEAPLSGKGKVYTYTVARQQLPGAYVQVPYAIAVVTLEEGCSIHTVVTEDSLQIMRLYVAAGQDREKLIALLAEQQP